MNDTLVVGGFNGLSRHQSDALNLRRRHGPPRDQLGQSRAFNVFEHQVPGAAGTGAYVVENRDVRVIQSGNRPCFPLETLGELDERRLDRHRSLQSRVRGTKHVAHPAPSDLLFNAVRPQLRAGRDRAFHLIEQTSNVFPGWTV